MVRPSFRLDRYSFAERVMIRSRLNLVVNRQRPFRLALRFVDQVAIAASKENQRRRCIGMSRIANNTHYEDDVIAAVIIRIRRALEMSESTRDQRRFGMTDAH